MCLHTIFGGTSLFSTRICGLHKNVESSIFEGRDAPLKQFEIVYLLIHFGAIIEIIILHVGILIKKKEEKWKAKYPSLFKNKNGR